MEEELSEKRLRTRRHIPNETLVRLPGYRAQLLSLNAEGVAVASSRALAARFGVSDTQLRRDLSYLGLLGRPGLGYRLPTLLEQVTSALGVDDHWLLAIVGCGALGTALARYQGFAASNLEVAAVFDVDPAKVGTVVGNTRVQHLGDAERAIAERPIDIALLTVPADHAQSAADVMVAAGIRALLNFAPTTLSVPPGVIVRGVDISSELQILTHLIISK